MKNTLQIGKFYNIEGETLRLERIDHLNRHDFIDGGHGTGRRLDPSRESDLAILEELCSVEWLDSKIADLQQATAREMVSLGYGK